MLDFEYEDQMSLLHHYHNALVAIDFAMHAQSGFYSQETGDQDSTACTWVALGVPPCQAPVAIGNSLLIALLFSFTLFKEQTLL